MYTLCSLFHPLYFAYVLEQLFRHHRLRFTAWFVTGNLNVSVCAPTYSLSDFEAVRSQLPRAGFEKLKTALDRFPCPCPLRHRSRPSACSLFFPLDFVYLNTFPLYQKSCLTMNPSQMMLSTSSTTSRRSAYRLSIVHIVRLTIPFCPPSPVRQVGKRQCLHDLPDAMLCASQKRTCRDQE